MVFTRRRSLPFNEWPTADKEMWQAVIAEGDILTLPLGDRVRLIEIRTLPERRGPPREAEACYRDLDPQG